MFRRVNAPTRADLEAVLQQLSSRLARMLVKEGVLTRDSENSYLTLDHLDVEPMQQVHGHSITYRIAIGPQQGKKVFTLQTLLPKATEDDRFTQVPNPRVNLTRLHGIFAPNSNYRVTITPAKRGKGASSTSTSLHAKSVNT